MDRRGRRAALILALALSAPASAQTLQAQRWMAKGADPRVLTRLPAECLAKPANAEAALSAEIGRAAFRTPTLLGGQAARAGLSCDSCHRNGRDNPHFHFPGISGAPGTADVTASLFSAHRGDGTFNPRPIPDLGGPKEKLRPQDGPALKTFIHGLIVEEFDGHEPPARVLDGLVTYVRDLRTCGNASTRLGASDYISDALRAVRAAVQALDRGDAPTAELLISGARARLGLIAERYPNNADVTVRLLAADRELSSIREAVHAGDRAAARARLQAWIAASPRWRRSARQAEPKSLFHPALLAAAGGD
jgi:hypothetical protein